MNMLRELFSADPEAESVKRARAVVEQAFADEDCCTCKSYIPVDPHLPGFVTAFPECRHGGLAMEHCDKYEKKDKPLWLTQKEAEAALKEQEG